MQNISWRIQTACSAAKFAIAQGNGLFVISFFEVGSSIPGQDLLFLEQFLSFYADLDLNEKEGNFLQQPW